MQKDYSLSLCMIARNEELFIEQCLSSVKGVVDEIIVVDTGSSDKTKEIAKRFQAKVIDFRWIDDFSAARNESLKHASKDWILVLDADEVIAKEDLIKLRELLADEECIGYYFLIRTYVDDSTAAGWVSSNEDTYKESKCASGWFSTRLIRLFRNNSAIMFKGVLHETIDPSIHKMGTTKDSPIPIHHFGRINANRSVYKQHLYQKLSELKTIQQNDFHSYCQLGIQAQEDGDYGKAVEMLKKSVELNKHYYKSWLNLGASYLKLDNLKEAEFALQQAAVLNPSDYSAHNNLGIVYSKLNMMEVAIKEFLIAVGLNPKSANSHFNLGLTFDSIGAKKEAHKAFTIAIKLNPMYKEKVNLT
ncbi:MAG: glycosyltransferase [Nanoarchaeota archaeon]